MATQESCVLKATLLLAVPFPAVSSPYKAFERKQHLQLQLFIKADVFCCSACKIAYSLIQEQEGRPRAPDDCISFVALLADPRYSGVSYLEKGEVRVMLREDPDFWTYRPLSELMVRAAADDVHFLLFIYYKMMEKLNFRSRCYLAVRDALYCHCFCINENNYAGWPPLPSIPDDLAMEGNVPEEEILSIVDVPQGKMGRVIGRRGANILSIKESCNAEIFIGGSKGPPDKVFVIGPVKQVRKAEAILRGRM